MISNHSLQCNFYIGHVCRRTIELYCVFMNQIVDRLQEESRAQFTGACDLADDYLNKKVLGLWKKGIPGLPDTYESSEFVQETLHTRLPHHSVYWE